MIRLEAKVWIVDAHLNRKAPPFKGLTILLFLLF
jgi:hypothetical protein